MNNPQNIFMQNANNNMLANFPPFNDSAAWTQALTGALLPPPPIIQHFAQSPFSTEAWQAFINGFVTYAQPTLASYFAQLFHPVNYHMLATNQHPEDLGEDEAEEEDENQDDQLANDQGINQAVRADEALEDEQEEEQMPVPGEDEEVSMLDQQADETDEEGQDEEIQVIAEVQGINVQPNQFDADAYYRQETIRAALRVLQSNPAYPPQQQMPFPYIAHHSAAQLPMTVVDLRGFTGPLIVLPPSTNSTYVVRQ